MIAVNDIRTVGWEPAILGMRNPLNSWNKYDTKIREVNGREYPQLGENDLKLAWKLSKAGSDHGKYLRMIHVYANVTAPWYWWKEYDTYKVGTVANSCSSMHTIMSQPFSLKMFSTDHMEPFSDAMNCLDFTVDQLNMLRDEYLRNKGYPEGQKKVWYQVIQLLPSSFNQLRTIDINYQVLKNMYQARKDHKLDEWKAFLRSMVRICPYSFLFTLNENSYEQYLKEVEAWTDSD